jgi:hypothetical protein
MRRRLLVLLCLVSLVANGQDVPRLGETLDVSIVNVDVFVTDRDGNRVHGLTRNDFEVYENGSGTQYHQIYMSADQDAFPNAVFRMRFSYVHDANGGNSVKSRAARNEIHYNWIEGALFHELDLIGSELYAAAAAREDSEVVGNVLVKSATSTGRIARIGGDGTGDADARYRFAHNTMILGSPAAEGTARWRTVVEVVPHTTAWMPNRVIVAPTTSADVDTARIRWVTVSRSSPTRIRVASAKRRSRVG